MDIKNLTLNIFATINIKKKKHIENLLIQKERKFVIYNYICTNIL